MGRRKYSRSSPADLKLLDHGQKRGRRLLMDFGRFFFLEVSLIRERLSLILVLDVKKIFHLKRNGFHLI